VFLFNENFHRTCGITVEVADNCSIVSKNDTGKAHLSTKTVRVNEEFDENEEISVGMTITLKNGPLKGYNGVVKSINKEKIEVRVLSKAHTEWVARKTLATKQEHQR
jgi:transcription antitermination factor NusG